MSQFKELLFYKSTQWLDNGIVTTEMCKIEHSRLNIDDYSSIINGEVDLCRDNTGSNKEKLPSKIIRCYKYFSDRLSQASSDEINRIRTKLIVDSHKILVVIDLNSDENEQIIFDTINSTGEKLTAADIIKNALFQNVNLPTQKRETTVQVTGAHIEQVKKYLFMLDLLTDCTERYESRGQAEHTVFAQPGMRYAIAKALVYSLMQDEYFRTRSQSDKNHITEKILENVKGRMMEDIVLLETSKAASRGNEVFKFKFDDGGEYDMVVYDEQSNTCRLYEVKHSKAVAERQTVYLRDEVRLALASRLFGKVDGRYVIYRGETQTVGDIQYLNVEEYLNALGE